MKRSLGLLILVGCGSPFASAEMAGSVSASSSAEVSTVTSDASSTGAGGSASNTAASSSVASSGQGGFGGAATPDAGPDAPSLLCYPYTPAVVPASEVCADKGADGKMPYVCPYAPSTGDCTNIGMGAPNGGDVFCCSMMPTDF